jgi:hypothetical protein
VLDVKYEVAAELETEFATEAFLVWFELDIEFVEGALDRCVDTGLALLENDSRILDLLDRNGGCVAVIVVVTW